MTHEKAKLSASAELSRIRQEVEHLQEDCFATAVPAEVLERVEAVLMRIAELTAELRAAGL